jgi:hypothetical protein
MPNVTNLGVAGSDGVVPLYQPNARWCWWGLIEIFQGIGTPGGNRYVPKINDYVMDFDNYLVYKVTALDSITLHPTLTPIQPPFARSMFSPADVLFGAGPGSDNSKYRLYVNSHLNPYTLNVDSFLTIPGNNVSYAKIFLGTDTSSNGRVISMLYDAVGTFVTNNVGLTSIANYPQVGYDVKQINQCNTNVILNNNDVATVVLYNQSGTVVSKRELLVVNTTTVSQQTTNQLFVTSIGLLSPFIQASTPNVISVPLNVPVASLQLMGIVGYSDGSTVTLPVDGTRFNLIGLDQVITTDVGQTIPMVLSYTLSTVNGIQEATSMPVSSNNRTVTSPWSLVVTNPNTSYSVRVLGFPEYNTVSNTYTMRWIMFGSDRNVWFDVTNSVSFATNTGPFVPNAWMVKQTKAIQLNLASVSGIYTNYVYTQLLDITLYRDPNAGTAFTVDQISGNGSKYGLNVYGAISGNYVSLSNNYPDLQTWLQNLYYNNSPIFNPATEAGPIVPTHFAIMYGGVETVYTIDQWNAVNLTAGVGTTYVPKSNVYLRFMSITPSGTQYLSMAGVPLI